MVKSGPLPAASAPTTFGQRFYGFMDYQQMAMVLDLLRNEKPVQFGWLSEDPNQFHLMSAAAPVDEGDGLRGARNLTRRGRGPPRQPERGSTGPTGSARPECRTPRL